MILVTSLGVKVKIWRGPTSEKCAILKLTAAKTDKVVKLSFPFCYDSVIRQFRNNLGQRIHL